MTKHFRLKKLRATLLIIFTLLFLISPAVICGQSGAEDDDETTISPDLKRKVDEAAARKAIAEARKAELDALSPFPDAASLRASTEFKEIKGEFIENRLLTYQAMSNVAAKIACRSRGALGKDATLVIYRQEDWAMVQKYVAVNFKQDQLIEWYGRLIADAEAQEKHAKELRDVHKGGGAIAPLAGLLTDLASLFQRKEILTPTLFDIADKELIAVFFNHFQNAVCENPTVAAGAPRLYYPGMVPISTGFVQMKESALWQKVLLLDAKYRETDKALRLLQQGVDMFNELEEELNEAQKTENAAVVDRQRVSQIEAVLKNLQTFKKQVGVLQFRKQSLDKFYEGLLKELGISFLKEPSDKSSDPEKQPKKEDPQSASSVQNTSVNVNVNNKEEDKKQAGGGGADFFSFLEAERLYKLMKDPAHKGYWVQLNVTKAGGNVRVVSIPIVDIFTGNRVRFSGGAIITYNVFDLDGRVALSGVVQDYADYASTKKIKKSLP